MRKLAFTSTALVVGVLSACGGVASSATAARPAASSATAKAAAKRTAHAISGCYKRKPASGDIYVRTVIPGVAAQAEEIGGGYSWDYAVGKCLSSVKFTIASAANGPGDCTTVGYVADNPGYDASATPARQLPDVADESGPGC